MLKPARELYGVMLLEQGKSGEALIAFEATLKKEPNRFNAIAGAGKAAERLGDQAKAKDYYQKLAMLARQRRYRPARPRGGARVPGEELKRFPFARTQEGCHSL